MCSIRHSVMEPIGSGSVYAGDHLIYKDVFNWHSKTNGETGDVDNGYLIFKRTRIP